MKKRRWLRRTLWFSGILFLLMNVVAFNHAWSFTHFKSADAVKTRSPERMNIGEKISAALFGVSLPRPQKLFKLDSLHQIEQYKGKPALEAVRMRPDSGSKGTVLLFHGYGGEKFSMLSRANFLRGLGYEAVCVDFRGAGGSDGNMTSIGYWEAEDVKRVFDAERKRGINNIILFGTSMGAAAVLRAAGELGVKPEKVILECPFGSMTQAVKNRFGLMGIPTFPMAHLVVFWGGVQQSFSGFAFNPSEYAKGVQCPSLLLYGKHDERVIRSETDAVYAGLNGPKELVVFEYSGHADWLSFEYEKWQQEIREFVEAAPEL